jgi:hypothetical protein
MQATILAIDVSNKECRQLSDLLKPLHITRRVVLSTTTSTPQAGSAQLR